MRQKTEIWLFVASRLASREPVMLLIVAESTGSSPGRAGYKMAVAIDGELNGSIGGGVMEVRLVEESRALLSEPGAVATGFRAALIEQVHQKNASNASGMICSGHQTVLRCLLAPEDLHSVESILSQLDTGERPIIRITLDGFSIGPPEGGTQNGGIRNFERLSVGDFVYTERLGCRKQLYIIGGGHCALALSEVMSRLDFHISIFDDRPELNTIDKNLFADKISVIDGYEHIDEHVPAGEDVYVVVMTLGYESDETVIRRLIDRDMKYLGVLGSKAKLKILLRNLENEGFDRESLDRICTPIGVQINSRTPEEIAISIASEIIRVKNSAPLS